ncbi:hypothetical protein Pmani_022919 [Petrolisthes manimaculis]|uniref:Uncharacterized protein n=1 Tax=Petrolisthes manimaculis TaxID=1843537 RepID=A0AAE1U0B7_9EUCA|nr:hypothetical protein Pmani_022919 [Petrolisthes manimaculis]
MAVTVQALVQAECCDEEVDQVLQVLAEEMNDLGLKNLDKLSSPMKILNIRQERKIQQKPPGVPFFTKPNHHLYTEDTLIWDTKLLEKYKLSTVKKLIKEGLMQRKFLRPQYPIPFIFHTMMSTTDENMCYQAYNSLSYLLQSTHTQGIRLRLDFYLALGNLGADLSKTGLDLSKLVKHPMIPSSPDHQDIPDIDLTPTLLRDKLKLALQLYSTILAETNNNNSDTSGLAKGDVKMENLDELIMTFIAVGLDPKVVQTNLDHHIANCITNCLNLYPSHLQFCKRVQELVENISTYCNYDPHNVAHVCCQFLLPTPQGCILRASLAFVQLQICLNVETKIVLDIVKLSDVTKLMEEKLSFIKEKEGYIIYFIVKLLDCCVYMENVDVLSDAEKLELKNLEQILDSVFTNIHDNVDDLNLTVVRFYSVKVLEKWKEKRKRRSVV